MRDGGQFSGHNLNRGEDDSWFDTTKTTNEALDLLEKERRNIVNNARAVAHELITMHGEAHVWSVRDEMVTRGLMTHPVDDPSGKRRQGPFWLGVVFRPKEFVWTGRLYSPPHTRDIGRSHQAHPCKIWTLRKTKGAVVGSDGPTQLERGTPDEEEPQ